MKLYLGKVIRLVPETTAAAGTTSPSADTHSGFLPFGQRWWPWVWAGRATEGRTRTRRSGYCDRPACAPEGSVKTCECYQTSCCPEEKHACVQRFLSQPPQQSVFMVHVPALNVIRSPHKTVQLCFSSHCFSPVISSMLLYNIFYYFSLYLLKARKKKRMKTSMSRRLKQCVHILQWVKIVTTIHLSDRIRLRIAADAVWNFLRSEKANAPPTFCFSHQSATSLRPLTAIERRVQRTKQSWAQAYENVYSMDVNTSTIRFHTVRTSAPLLILNKRKWCTLYASPQMLEVVRR